jgi:Dolichyl-phosphate-mannose-protein mannosyltransferase
VELRWRLCHTAAPKRMIGHDMRFAPLWLLLLALVVRALAIVCTQHDGLYGQDAYSYLDCAREIAHFLPGELPCRSFFWPLGYPALASVFMRATGTARGAQLASVAVGAAIAPLVYWLAIQVESPGVRRAAIRRAAVAAGLCAALGGMLLQSSIVIMSDAAGLFWATLSASVLLRWGQTTRTTRSYWLLLIAGIAALALAAVTRWIYGGLLIPFAAFIVVVARRQYVAGRSVDSASRGGASRAAIVPVVVAGLVFSSIVGPQLYVSEVNGAPALGHAWVVNWSPVNALHTSFDTPDGHADYRVPPLIFFAAPLFHPLFLCPLLTVCVFIGAWQLRRSPALVLLGGWAATLYLYLIGIPFENLRFGLAFFTPVAVLAGIGVFSVPIPGRLLAAVSAWRSRRGATAATDGATAMPQWLLLALSLALAAPFTLRALVRLHSSHASEIAAVRFVQSRVPADATVVTFDLSMSLEYRTRLKIVDLYAQTPALLRQSACGKSISYLYVEQAKLESQWTGRSPAENFHWLQDHADLQDAGQYGDWRLYRILSCSF